MRRSDKGREPPPASRLLQSWASRDLRKLSMLPKRKPLRAAQLQGDEAVEAICAVIRRIPVGWVATYGQVAAMAGMPRRARLVGRVRLGTTGATIAAGGASRAQDGDDPATRGSADPPDRASRPGRGAAGQGARAGSASSTTSCAGPGRAPRRRRRTHSPSCGARDWPRGFARRSGATLGAACRHRR